MTVMFDVHEEALMKYVLRGEEDRDRFDIVPLQDEALRVIDNPHINKLYEDVLERIEASPKHPVT